MSQQNWVRPTIKAFDDEDDYKKHQHHLKKKCRGNPERFRKHRDRRCRRRKGKKFS